MAESLESLVEKFRINLTETIQKLEEENHEKEATLEAKHQQELELLDEKECVEKEELDAKQKVEREHLDAKQSLRKRDLMVKQHQEKEKLKNDYGKKLKDTKANKMCPNTSKKEVPECPVCLEPLNPPMRIFQCSYGHYLCENCNNNKEIKSCPTCRRQIVGRNIGMEQAIQLIGAPTDKEVVQNQQKSDVESQIDGRGLICGTCTLINKEGDKFCDTCGATLGMVYSPIRPARMNSPDFPPLMRPTEGRLGQSPAHRGHGQSLGRPGQSRPVGVDRCRGMYSGLQCSSETTASGQSRPLGMVRGRAVGRGRYSRLQCSSESTASGQSRQVGEDRGRAMGRGRYSRPQCSSETMASGQSHTVGVGRGRAHLLSPHCEEAESELSFCPRIATFNADHINQVEAAEFHNGMSMYNGGFPPPVPVGHAMGANVPVGHAEGANVPVGHAEGANVPVGHAGGANVFEMNGVQGNNYIHVPTGRLVELETQSPPERGVRRGLARARDRGKRIDYLDDPCTIS